MRSARCPPRPGTPAPIRQPPARLRRDAQISTTTLSSRTIFCRRWNSPARSATAPAGSPCISSPRTAARSSARSPATPNRIRRANTSSTTAGPTPMSAPAATTIRSCRSRCRSRRRTGRRLLVRPGEHAEAVRNALADSLADICKRSNASSVHVTFLTEEEWRMLGVARLSAAHPPPVPLGERRLRQFRRLPRRPLLAQAQDHPPRARGRAGERHHGRLADRLRPHRKRVGHVLRVLHGHRLAQMGPALSHALVLFHRRREDARQDPAGDGEAQWPLHRRRHQLHRFRHAVRPPLGLHRAAPVPAFRGLLLPGHRNIAIEHKLARVEAGAGGSHKVTRGYMPITTYSAHYIADPRLRRAIDDFLSHERAHVRRRSRNMPRLRRSARKP